MVAQPESGRNSRVGLTETPGMDYALKGAPEVSDASFHSRFKPTLDDAGELFHNAKKLFGGLDHDTNANATSATGEI